ncbi:hypothetical protein E4U16_004340 [Claviceps sp. LM84 group G4]|nr:hypothetical protein E4U16_004340 [Claviceps sp. LM84 group G4]
MVASGTRWFEAYEDVLKDGAGDDQDAMRAHKAKVMREAAKADPIPVRRAFRTLYGVLQVPT